MALPWAVPQPWRLLNQTALGAARRGLRSRRRGGRGAPGRRGAAHLAVSAVSRRAAPRVCSGEVACGSGAPSSPPAASAAGDPLTQQPGSRDRPGDSGPETMPGVCEPQVLVSPRRAVSEGGCQEPGWAIEEWLESEKSRGERRGSSNVGPGKGAPGNAIPAFGSSFPFFQSFKNIWWEVNTCVPALANRNTTEAACIA